MLINTVLGKMDTASITGALMHEHVTCADWSMRMNFGDKFFKYDKLVEIASAQLAKLKDYGINLFVDGTAVNLGRDINLLRDVSRRSGINIVASSGFYYQEEAWLAMRDEGEIHDLLLDECLNGISGTDSLPGIMKNGITADGVTPLQKKLIHCVGTVAAETGLNVFCHHDPSVRSGLEVLEVYASAGLAPGRVILGHSGDTNDRDYHEALCKAGAWIGFDRLAYDGKPNLVKNSVANVISLCEKGYMDHIFLSHDWASYLAFWDGWDKLEQSDWANLDVDFTFVSRVVIPMLKAGGLTEKDIHTIMVDNPKRFFEGK